MSRALFDEVQNKITGGPSLRERELHPSDPHLLKGLVQDEQGRPFAPSHTIKKGRRYRYYVNRPPKDGAMTEMKRMSLPALELERRVLQGLSRWLGDGGMLTRDLGVPDGESDEWADILVRARQYGDMLTHCSPLEQRKLLLSCVRSVQVSPQGESITLDRDGLLQSIGVTNQGPGKATSAIAPVIMTAATTINTGMELRLVIREAWAQAALTEVEEHLVLSIARAHGWWQRLVSGQSKSIRDIAKQDGLTADYVAKLLRGGLFAPDIVEAALEGNALGLTWRHLLVPRALSWPSQCETFIQAQLP